MSALPAIKSGKVFSQQEALALQTFGTGNNYIVADTTPRTGEFAAFLVLSDAVISALSGVDNEENVIADCVALHGLSGVTLPTGTVFRAPNYYTAITLSSGTVQLIR